VIEPECISHGRFVIMQGIRKCADVDVDARFDSVSVFAARVGATPVTVRKWIAQGMPAVRVDRYWRVDVQRAVQWMRGCSRG
jgi:hypothetical protein